MKSLVVVTFLSLVSTLTFANVKPFGTFEASQCSQGSPLQVCFGYKAGMKKEYLSVQSSRSSQLFLIASTEPVNGGINPLRVGARLTLKDEATGATSSIIVITNSADRNVVVYLNGKLPSGQKINAGNFEYVMHTM